MDTTQTEEPNMAKKAKDKKLVSLKKIAFDYDVSFRRLVTAMKREAKEGNIQLVQARVKTEGGVQVGLAVYLDEAEFVIADLQSSRPIADDEVSTREAASQLGISVKRIESECKALKIKLADRYGTPERHSNNHIKAMTKSQFRKLQSSLDWLTALPEAE